MSICLHPINYKTDPYLVWEGWEFCKVCIKEMLIGQGALPGDGSEVGRRMGNEINLKQQNH